MQEIVVLKFSAVKKLSVEGGVEMIKKYDDIYIDLNKYEDPHLLKPKK